VLKRQVILERDRLDPAMFEQLARRSTGCAPTVAGRSPSPSPCRAGDTAKAVR